VCFLATADTVVKHLNVKNLTSAVTVIGYISSSKLLILLHFTVKVHLARDGMTKAVNSLLTDAQSEMHLCLSLLSMVILTKMLC